MMLTWKRTTSGVYESSAQYWDTDALEHKPVYKIVKYTAFDGRAWFLFVKGVKYVIEREFSKLLNKEIEITLFATLKYAKATAQRLEDEKPQCQTEEEKALGAGNGYAGAVYITADGRGGAWHTDGDGNIIED